MKRPVAFLVISTLLVWMGTVCAQIITGSISFSQIAGTLSLTTQVTGQLAPANGGVGAMTGAPMWARNFGDGSDGAGPSGANELDNLIYQFNASGWTCNGAITRVTSTTIFIRSQGPVNLASGCSFTAAKSINSVGDWGGAGGSGGSGAANSTASRATAPFNPAAAVVSTYIISAAGGASSSSAGNPGGAITADKINSLLFMGPYFSIRGAGPGTAGGSTGGAAGNGAEGIVIVAPSITIASGVTIDVAGSPGVAPTANSTGAGGGGGGGVIIFSSETFTDNGGIYKFGGAPGGAVTQPSIQATGGGCTAAGGCGTGAVLTVTGVTTGGLDAAKITITNGGSGYQIAPDCRVNAGGSGLIGSPACHFTIAAGAINGVVIDTAGSGAVFTAFTTAFIGGYGANGWYKQVLIQ